MNDGGFCVLTLFQVMSRIYMDLADFAEEIIHS